MDITQCPQCKIRVLPTNDGKCPSCSRTLPVSAQRPAPSPPAMADASSHGDLLRAMPAVQNRDVLNRLQYAGYRRRTLQDAVSCLNICETTHRSTENCTRSVSIQRGGNDANRNLHVECRLTASAGGSSHTWLQTVTVWRVSDSEYVAEYARWRLDGSSDDADFEPSCMRVRGQGSTFNILGAHARWTR